MLCVCAVARPPSVSPSQSTTQRPNDPITTPWQAEYKRAGLDSDEDEEGDAAHYNEGGSDDADDAADADVDKLFGGGSEDEDGGGGGSKKQQQKGGGGGGSGGGGGRLRRRAAAADEQMGESTAGGAEGGDGDIGGLFDEEMEDVDQDEVRVEKCES